MKILQILLFISFILYVLVQIPLWGGDSKEGLKYQRRDQNTAIIIAVILFVILYFCGTFDKIF